MWRITTLVLSLLIVGITGKPTPDPEEFQSCKDILNQHGMTMDDFSLAAAHGSHSLYLEDIRHFFEPDAPEQNRIPVLNFNLGSQDTIWPNSPLVGFDQNLLSYGFQTMDFIFTSDNENFLIKGLTVIEKLGHSFHMHNMWAKAKQTYLRLMSGAAEDMADFCSCVTDNEKTGILGQLAMIAETNKHFGDEIPKELLKDQGVREKGFDYGMNYDKDQLEAMKSPEKAFDYGMNYDKGQLQLVPNQAKAFDYGMNYDKDQSKLMPSNERGFDYGMNYIKDQTEAMKTPEKAFDYGMNYDKNQQNPGKAFDYGMNYDKGQQQLVPNQAKAFDNGMNHNKDQSKQMPRGFDYGMNYNKDQPEAMKTPGKAFDYGMNYDQDLVQPRQNNEKGFDYGMNYDKIQQNPDKAFDYGMNYDKDQQQLVPIKDKAFDYGMNYDKDPQLSAPIQGKAFDHGMNYGKDQPKSEPITGKGFDYGMNYDRDSGRPQREEKTPENGHKIQQESESNKWFPGTVTDAYGYPKMKKMLMKSMMTNQEIEMFAHYIFCKLNF